MQRYAKPHALTMHNARLPQPVKACGRLLLTTFDEILLFHMPEHHPWTPAMRAELLPLRRRRGGQGPDCSIPARA